MIDNTLKLKHRELNPKVLALLLQQGVDKEIPIPAINIFYIRSAEDISLVTDELRNHGFEILERHDPMENGNEACWAVHVSMEIIPTIANLNKMTDLCNDLADKLNCEYDGWYCVT